MERLLVILTVILGFSLALPFLYETVRRVILNWSRTTTLFFWICILILAILVISRW